jgi:uncharacterized protein involved in outer membrane biogenesis
MRLESVKNNKWVRRAMMAAGGIVVLWGLAWATVPGLVKSQLERLASEQLGRPVSLGAVHFRPWSLELTLDDLVVAGHSSTVPQLQIKQVYLDAELQSLLRLAPVVDAVRIKGPHLRLTHLGDGQYDVDDVLARLLAPAEPSRSLPRFAIYNVVVTGGAIDFTDQRIGRTHEVRELNLSIPFLSTFDSRRDVATEPRLAFRLDGGNFDSSAQTTPFAPSRKTDATLRLSHLDLRPYLPYLPAVLPVKVQAGVLGADVRLHFEQSPRTLVRLSGSVTLQGLQLAERGGQALLTLDGLRVEMADVRPLEQVVRLAAVELNQPQLAVRRDRAGHLNLLQLAPAGPAPATRSAPAEPPSLPWQLAAEKLAVRDGRLRWTDASTAPAAAIELSELALEASTLAWPLRQPATFKGSLRVAASPQGAGGRLRFQGEAREQAASLKAELDDLPLALAAPYTAQWLAPAPGGRLNAELVAQWKDAQWRFQVPRLEVRQLTLGSKSRTDPKEPLAVAKLVVEGADIGLAERRVTLAKVNLVQPAVALERDGNGRWMVEHWLRTAATPATPSTATGTRRAAAQAAPDAKPWRVAVGEVALEGGQIRYADRALARPVRLEVSALTLQARNLASDGRQPEPFKLSAQVRARRGDAGRLTVNGRLALQPLTLQGRVQAVDLPAHALSPYLGDVLNLRLLRADTGFKGYVRYAQTAKGPQLRVKGDVLLEDLRANTVPDAASGQDLPVGEELLSWKALSLRGFELALAPAQPTRVTVSETALSDFYARIIIHESGRINLQDLVKTAAPPAAAEAPPASPAGGSNTAPSAAPVIAMGPVSLVNGRVQFSDRYIKPNYSADLSELTGRLSAFSSVPASGEPGTAPAMADLELRGRAEGTATIEILGKLNPLAQPLALDITGKMRDLELPPLSPYSVKYAGHGIERGKLSMDVSYQVQPDGQLVANNKLVLNQLTFGDPVEGAPTSLPVRLAVALLADRNGVIDINLPISGSLNDPEFRLGPVIFRVIVNLIAKAVTAPFALLASALGGGGEEMGTVHFAPGSAGLGDEARANLDKVVQAMKDRPALTLTVAGTASLEAEREGYKRERLGALLLAEKRRAAVVAGQPAEAVAAVTEAERPTLLKAVYRRAQIAKPRNLLGLAKDLPPAEMEALLLASLPATEQHMRELALARAVAVRDYLGSRELPADRLFLGAAKAEPADAKWVPHAELMLSMP